MRILVTGVAGFMGSHLAEYLASKGHNVAGLDNLSIGRAENVPDGVYFYKVDLTNTKETETLIKTVKPELIYHLAAWAHEGLSQFMPKLITENNYNAFLNLIVPAVNNGMKRIVVTSSMSVYGDQPPPFHEELPRKPVDIYGIAKTAMEQATEVLADVHGFDYTIVRPHNVYGPKQALWDPYRNVVGIFINRALKNQSPIIYGDGEQTRAFSYIDDVTPYIAECGLQEDMKGEIVNIGPCKEYSINELAHCVIGAFNTKLELEYEPDRPREVKHAYCSSDKAKRLLGYKAKTDLETGVKKMVEWALAVGPQEFEYLKKIELAGDKIPKIWQEKRM